MRWWRVLPRWRRYLYALLAVTTVAAGVWLLTFLFLRPDTCADGVERVGDQCVGVNGEGYDFGTPEISDVARAIERENKRVAGRPHVTVALMLPLQADTDSGRDRALRRQMRSDLQGAYLGQRQANDSEGEPPKIRLVLANPGRGYQHQGKVVDTLLRMADSSRDRLRAVTGLNLSLDETEAAVRRLTEHQVPVLASRISGDRIANEEPENGTASVGDRKFPGLARIIPVNSEAVRALAHFSGERGREDRRTVLVTDERKDGYNNTMAEAFSGIEEEGPPGPAPMSFESPSIDDPGTTGNQFDKIANNICDSEADTVYFAGRTLHLRIFALKLAQVDCKNRHYTIVSGSDAASLRQSMSEKDWETLRADGRAKVTVQYSAPAHPDAWKTELADWKKRWAKKHDGQQPSTRQLPQYLTEPATALETLRKRIATTRQEGVDIGARPQLDDSRTMLVYDGMLTISKALHQAQGEDARMAPHLRDIKNQWSLLQSRHRVRGTSGLICLTNVGNPYDKPVAVVKLDPGREGLGKLRFVGLGWPTGKEQPRNCLIPSRTD
ncbi:amino acid ABC transporter substrate-binding protein [Streptomyces sp. NPDC005438]|uniref:amino acid ABC transporter substrate-binding protein n=1 Tax=Streptomyces sp. NPDC005438 TaxID=3156880 RepID=UPI0033A5DE4F